MSVDVAVLGIGMYPFGRHDGISGRTQGAAAVRAALADAGTSWETMQFAFGGSMEGGDADTLVSDLGLTALPFVNVWNACATGGSALAMADSAIRSGAYDLGVAVGFDKHPRGAFNADPASVGLGRWYGETGLMLTTQFFAMKINRYMHDYGISESTLAKVAAKNFRNGSLNPNAWRQKPISEDEIRASRMLNYPLTQYMFCSPDEGAAAVVVCRADQAARYTDRPVRVQA
ncbi:MAG: thiolase family protein, partial [Actinomycetota bacterium]